MRVFSSYISDKRGATVIEYALLAAGIGLAIFGTLFVIGDQLVAVFQTLSDAMATIVTAEA